MAGLPSDDVTGISSTGRQHPLGTEASRRFDFKSWGRHRRPAAGLTLKFGIGSLAAQTHVFNAVVGRSLAARKIIGQPSALRTAGAGQLPVRPPQEYLPVAEERHHFTVSPSDAERRNRSFIQIQEKMSGVHHGGRSSGPIGLPRATSRASQSRMGRQTGPAGAAQRMVSQPAYVSNPRDVSGAGRLLTPRDRLAVEPRNASADQASPARRFVTPIAAPGVAANASTSAAPLQRVPFYNRPSQSNSPFPSHAHLTTTVGRALDRSPGPVLVGRGLARTAPASSVPAGSVPAGSVPAGSVPAGSGPAGPGLAGSAPAARPGEGPLSTGSTSVAPRTFPPTGVGRGIGGNGPGRPRTAGAGLLLTSGDSLARNPGFGRSRLAVGTPSTPNLPSGLPNGTFPSAVVSSSSLGRVATSQPGRPSVGSLPTGLVRSGTSARGLARTVATPSLGYAGAELRTLSSAIPFPGRLGFSAGTGLARATRINRAASEVSPISLGIARPGVATSSTSSEVRPRTVFATPLRPMGTAAVPPAGGNRAASRSTPLGPTASGFGAIGAARPAAPDQVAHQILRSPAPVAWAQRSVGGFGSSVSLTTPGLAQMISLHQRSSPDARRHTGTSLPGTFDSFGRPTATVSRPQSALPGQGPGGLAFSGLRHMEGRSSPDSFVRPPSFSRAPDSRPLPWPATNTVALLGAPMVLRSLAPASTRAPFVPASAAYLPGPPTGRPGVAGPAGSAGVVAPATFRALAPLVAPGGVRTTSSPPGTPVLSSVPAPALRHTAVLGHFGSPAPAIPATMPILRSAAPALPRASLLGLARATSPGSAEVEPVTQRQPLGPLVSRTPAKTVISPLVMAATLPPAAPGLTGSPAGHLAVGPRDLPTHVTTAKGTVISRRVGSGLEGRQPPSYPAATVASAMSTTTAPVMGRAIVPQLGGLEAQAQRAYMPAAAAVRPGAPVSPAALAVHRAQFASSSRAPSFTNRAVNKARPYLPAASAAPRSLFRSRGQGFFGTSSAFAVARSGYGGSTVPPQFAGGPPAPALFGPLALTRPARLDLASSRSVTSPPAPFRARTPAAGQHATAGSGRPVVLRRPALPTVMARNGVSGTRPIAGEPQRQLYGMAPTTVPGSAPEPGVSRWPAPPAPYLPGGHGVGVTGTRVAGVSVTGTRAAGTSVAGLGPAAIPAEHWARRLASSRAGTAGGFTTDPLSAVRRRPALVSVGTPKGAAALPTVTAAVAAAGSSLPRSVNPGPPRLHYGAAIQRSPGEQTAAVQKPRPGPTSPPFGLRNQDAVNRRRSPEYPPPRHPRARSQPTYSSGPAVTIWSSHARRRSAGRRRYPGSQPTTDDGRPTQRCQPARRAKAISWPQSTACDRARPERTAGPRAQLPHREQFGAFRQPPPAPDGRAAARLPELGAELAACREQAGTTSEILTTQRKDLSSQPGAV